MSTATASRGAIRVVVPEPRVLFACPGCGTNFELSAGTSRRYARTGVTPLCRPCRFPPIIVVTDQMIDYWTTRFDEQELVEIAEGMWGPREQWASSPPQLRL